jgi:hypothetical protein
MVRPVFRLYALDERLRRTGRQDWQGRRFKSVSWGGSLLRSLMESSRNRARGIKLMSVEDAHEI